MITTGPGRPTREVLMKLPSVQRTRRPGAIAPLAALTLLIVVAMVAFCVDMAFIVETEAELQTVADASALAAVQQLMGDSQHQNGIIQYYLPGQTNQATIMQTAMANARSAASACAASNTAGGLTNLALSDADIEFGITSANGVYTALPTAIAQAVGIGFPNTVKVTVRRDGQTNSSVNLFFAPAIGTSSVNLAASAAATIYTGTVDGFQNNFGQYSGILPVTYDVNFWNNFLATGQGPDGSLSWSPSGTLQLQVYPSIKFTGDFGLLSLDQSNDGASTVSGWIDNGVSQSDLQQEYNANLLPLSSHDPTQWNWKGTSGLTTDAIHTLSYAVGNYYLLPLFKPVDAGVPNPLTYQPGVGTGTNYNYNIVQFVGVQVTYVDNKSVYVQPTNVLDPTAVFSSVKPAGPGTVLSPLTTTFTMPKLTQ
jgi:hypothetical protein